MSFLTVDGIPAPVAEDSYAETPREVGSTALAFDGTPNRTRQSIKTDIAFSTPPLSSADAKAWRYLLEGRGEVWSFDSSLYGCKGLGPNAGSVAAAVSTTQKKFGASSLRMLDGTSTITYATGLPSSWTVMFWRWITGSGVWFHIATDSAGTKWLDGVVNAGLVITNTMNVTSGSVVLTNTIGSGTIYIDNLVVLPFVLPSTWVPIFGVATAAFTALPKLALAGDIIPETTRTAMGAASSMKPLRGILSGVNAVTHRTLAVSLSEV